MTRWGTFCFDVVVAGAGSGEVSYNDTMGCYCTNTSAGECSVQCDDTDTTCGDITACPH